MDDFDPARFSMILVVVHPPGSGDNWPGATLRALDIEEYTEWKMIGEVIPMYYEHIYELGSIGFWERYAVDDEGALVMFGYIDLQTMYGSIAYWQIKNNVINGASVRIEYDQNDENSPIYNREVTECSLTRIPRLDGTRILFCAGLPLSWKKSGVYEGMMSIGFTKKKQNILCYLFDYIFFHFCKADFV